jgi:Acyltransferase family.
LKTEPETRIDKDLSVRIELARILCIFFMMYAHVPALRGEPDFVGHEFRVFDFFWLFVTDGASRSSAALLSVVAGFLCYHALNRRANYREYAIRRFKTTYLPCILWAGLSVGVAAALAPFMESNWLTRHLESSHHKILDVVNCIFFLTSAVPGATLFLSFLRDLFVCSLLAPILIAALSRAPATTFLATGALMAFDVKTAIVFRPMILFGVTFGLWLAMRRIDVRRWDGYLWPLGTAFATSCILAVLLLNGQFMGLARSDAPTELALGGPRLFGALFFWVLTAQFGARLTERLIANAGPACFLAFCSHGLVLSLIFHAFWKPNFGGYHDALWPLWFCVAPAVAFAAAWAIRKGVATVSPRLAQAIAGGRINAKPQAMARMEKALGEPQIPTR